IGRFRIDVQRRRIVLYHGDDPLGVRPRPTGAAVAAAPGVVLQLPELDVSVWIGVGTVRIFSTADIPQQGGRMSADLTFPGIRRFAFAFKLNERADQSFVLRRCGAVIAFERRPRLGGYVRPTGR